MASRASRLTIVFAAVVVIALAAIWGGAKLVNKLFKGSSASQCTVGSFTVDTDQAAVASTMVGAASKYRPRLPDRAAMLALAAALQESKLRNLAPGDGDRDSVGILQQRPSQGWGGGDPARLNDVTEATREFLSALVKVDHWQNLPAADAIQAVQISADGTAYAQHEPEAQALADALLGNHAAGVSCTFAKPTLVAAPKKVITQLRQQVPLHSATATGLTISVVGGGWQAVAWFVANADRLGVDSVAYDGKRWSRAHGWQDATASRAAVVATMAKL
jgi:hypothetical protein